MHFILDIIFVKCILQFVGESGEKWDVYWAV